MKDADMKDASRGAPGDASEAGLTEEERRALRAARRDALLDVPLDLRTRVQEDKRRKRRDAPKHKGRALEDDGGGAGGRSGTRGKDGDD
ncbi:hypothetical protein [Nitratidesulfovibrio sp. SRB-5]|uniref:hypothetical protein n=1 Tax=Nitratidesulfovibrio sp. SRB-5 TaxID=2872636 RepID=UPI00102560E2|nr:hypothetical protein [Nitratidesulfovibrio sp. SRB-5]MBZ2172153.1 hypothetical protein [Nitratidesulfovibrio sp. SRB-5]RXF77349.1 hypothetical protein EKK70_06775 [Desulfovibrio sp. DS-1]